MNTRALAATVLGRVVQDGESLTAALDAILPQIPQDADRAFVQALCFGVARWYFRLDHLLRQLADKPIRDEEIRLLLLLGLYQLEYTRVKPHAAVSETVNAVGGKTWARGLINGVLRNYQRRREELQARVDADPEGLAHPSWLVDMLQKDWPADWRELLAQGNRQAPMSLRVNLAKGSREDYLRGLAEQGFSARAGRHAPGAVVLEQAAAVGRLPGFAEGWVSVQDEAAQLAAPLLNLEAGQRVLDLCAAPGGKTSHILESRPNLGEVVALDIAPERVARIGQNLQRLDLSATVLTGDGLAPESWWDGRPFDRILLDAPCSATGVIRRHPDIKLLRRPEDVAQLRQTQGELLRKAWPLLAPGGELLYATCSILRRENEARIADFLSHVPDAQELPIPATWGRAAAHGRQILTGENDMDGFYYARLRKSKNPAKA